MYEVKLPAKGSIPLLEFITFRHTRSTWLASPRDWTSRGLDVSLEVLPDLIDFLGEFTRVLRVETIFFSGITFAGFIMFIDVEVDSTGFGFKCEKYCELGVCVVGLDEEMLNGDVDWILHSRFTLVFWPREDRREFVDLPVRTGVNLPESEGLGMKLRDSKFSGDRSSERLLLLFFFKYFEWDIDIVYNDLALNEISGWFIRSLG